MASTYSSLKIQLMATGENSGTWGNVTNDNLGVAIEEAIAESADVTFSGSNVSISLTDTNASQTARNLRLNLTGTNVAATQALTVPDIEKPYIVNNGLSDPVEVMNSTGANVTVPAGKTMWVYSTGSGVVDVTNHASSLTLSTPLAAGSGGTGLNALGTNVATFLGTPSSANLAAALTDETGTGVAVFGTNPTLTGLTLAGNMDAADYFVTKPTLKDYAIEGSIVGNTGADETIDFQTANFFAMTADQNCTFTFSNPPASGNFGVFVLELTNGGAFTLTWPASVDWVGGTAPTLTAAGVDQLVFTTRDGGTTYFGFVAGLDIKSP